jgi:hypothetical protein
VTGQGRAGPDKEQCRKRQGKIRLDMKRQDRIRQATLSMKVAGISSSEVDRNDAESPRARPPDIISEILPHGR